MESIGSCDLCGGKDQETFEVYKRYGSTVSFVECECGLAYLTPRPTPSEIAQYYDEEYDKRHIVYHQPPLQRFLVVLLRQALRLRYHGNGAARFAVRFLLYPWELKWRRILRNAHMDAVNAIGRLLDVGCAHGYFLSAMKRWGFQCYGCEPDPRAARVAQDAGLDVVCSDLIQAPYSTNEFDVVRFHHVLEHVHSPSAVLSRARDVVKPGGLVIVESPNHLGIVAQAFRQSEQDPGHLFSFSPSTLTRYFVKSELRVIKVKTLTRSAYHIYSQLGRFASEFSKQPMANERRRTAEFWSPNNRQRMREFQKSARFFDAMGRGSAVAVVGMKD